MEFFNNARAVRLKSHLNKYLVADEDQETVRQSRNGSTKKARWFVEFVEKNPHLIRLKSVHGKYLCASEESFLLTGKKVVQSLPLSKRDSTVEWEPIKEGYQVRLRTKGGGVLRANGATPPWRNSVTHDLPQRTATQEWVLWQVDVVDISQFDSVEYLSSGDFSSSLNNDVDDKDDTNSTISHTQSLPEQKIVSSITSKSCSSSPSSSSPNMSSTISHAQSMPEQNDSSSTITSKSCSSPSPSSSSSSPNVSSAISHTQSMPQQNVNLSNIASKSCSSSYPRVSKAHFMSMRLGLSSRSHPGSPGQGISGMEFFERAKSVRLQSHLGKYLVADDDEETVRQSRNGSSNRARWTVEFIEGKNNLIRLKSCHGLYLSATDDAYLLGMTGKKVKQILPSNKKDPSMEWEPLKEGLHVKLRTSEGNYLRANGATPPWRNSITHDIPHRTATQDWVLWGVDVTDIDINVAFVSDGESVVSDVLSSRSSTNSCHDGGDDSGWPGGGSPDKHSPTPPLPPNSERSLKTPTKLSSGMEFFKKAKVVRLKSHHNKYLIADDDQEKVIQERDGSSKSASWTVEFVDDFDNVLRLKSCFGKYLTATEEQVLLGVTGRSVKQTMPKKLNSSVEWEPIREGVKVKLKTRYGNYLRANGGLPPWRNSITHDIPHRHNDWILWELEVVQTRPETPKKILRLESLDEDIDSSEFALRTPGFTSHTSFDSQDDSSKKSEGRTIFYRVADEDGNIDDEDKEISFLFKGHGLEELTETLEEKTGHEKVMVCLRNKFNGEMYPVRLSLPPNNATMHVVVVPSTSKC